MLISLPRDESTILLMDLHLTKILAVGKPNFIEVNRIINIAGSALGLSFSVAALVLQLLCLAGRGARWCFAKTVSNVSVWVRREVGGGRCNTSKTLFFVVSSSPLLRPHPSPPPEREKSEWSTLIDRDCRDTLLSLVEPYYAGAKVYAHISVCTYGIIFGFHATKGPI